VVCSGTLEQLLHELFSDEDDREGSRGEYGSVFLMMHTYFITSPELLDVLVARFQTVAQSTDLGDLDKKAMRMQLRIVNLLKKWLSGDFLKAADTYPEMLERLRAHCSTLRKEVGGQLASW
jgi:RasGEF N-terminal motif